MARTGSSTSSTARRSRAKAKPEGETTETQVEATETPNTEAHLAEVDSTDKATEEAPVSTDTVEAAVDETVNSDTTESDTEATGEVTGEATSTTGATSTTEADEKADTAEKEMEGKFESFKSTVANALAERDTSTGTVPDAQIELVKEAYRQLVGAKWKRKAKDHLNDGLRDAVNNQDIVLGGAVMALSDAVTNAGPAPRAQAERKPVDPAAAYRERLTVLHLAYSLASSNVPDGIDADAERAKVEETVGGLTDEAEKYFAWLNSTAEDKGEAPEVNPLVVKAVKAAQLKAATAGRAASTGSPRTSSGERRNVRTHIAQVFADKPSGTFLKISEIAKTTTEEYPDGSCSPGAVTAALKSEKGVEGFQLVQGDGPAGARKL